MTFLISKISFIFINLIKMRKKKYDLYLFMKMMLHVRYFLKRLFEFIGK